MTSDARSTDDSSAAADLVTGLPGLRTWPRLYWLVVIVFAVYVILLTALSKAFA